MIRNWMGTMGTVDMADLKHEVFIQGRNCSDHVTLIRSKTAICVRKSFCAGTSQFLTNYSLVNVYMTMENGHFDWENPFEMVMFHGHVQLPEGISLQFFAFDFLSLFLSVWGPNKNFFSDLLGGCIPRIVGQMVHPQV